MWNRVTTSLAVLGLFLPLPLCSAAPVDFSKQIAPILSSRCVHCHNARQKKGGLSLETAQDARRGGESGVAIVPGKPQESPLVAMIEGAEPDMPKNDTPLKQSQVKLIGQWIKEGARWPAKLRLENRFRPSKAWWSLRPLTRPAVPRLTGKDQSFVRSPIDAFIVARLKKQGMTLSKPATRRTVIRRLSFDLRGLPPTPDEIRRFLADSRPGAYERLVDRFLASAPIR